MWKEREGRQQILKTKHNIFAIIYNLFWVYYFKFFKGDLAPLGKSAKCNDVLKPCFMILYGKWWNQ